VHLIGADLCQRRRPHRVSGLVATLTIALITVLLSACGDSGSGNPGLRRVQTVPLPGVGQPANARICDTTVPTGAASPVFLRLRPSGGPPPPAPTRSRLPSPVTAQVPNYSAAKYVRTSQSCAVGAIVVVTPSTGSAVAITVPSKDGALAAIGLDVTSPITVQAWVDGKYQGSIHLNP
jgi:hypothetical protein